MSDFMDILGKHLVETGAGMMPEPPRPKHPAPDDPLDDR